MGFKASISLLYFFFFLLHPLDAFVPMRKHVKPSAHFSLPVAIIVEATIVPERVDEFLKVIEEDAKGSRLEEGCLQFDVLRSQNDSNIFYFYEVYSSQEAVEFHKKQPHFALWTKFKESGGVIKSVSQKANGIFMT